MKSLFEHSIRTVATTLLLLVVSGIIYAQQPAGITTDKATRITAPVTLTVQSGSNYIRFDADHLPAVVTYIPAAAFGTIPAALVMGDTIEAEMVFADCGVTWRWTIEEGESDKITEIKAHENATIFVAPHTCDITYSDTTAVVCDSLLWKGIWRYESGDYEYVTSNAAGCDSIVTLHLTVNKSVYLNMRGIEVCDSYMWGDTLIETSGTYTRRLHTINGCDSIVTQTIIVNHSTTEVVRVTAYDRYEWLDGVEYTASIVGPEFVLHNQAGCDSILKLDLTIRHLLKDTVREAVCSTELPFVWRGQPYSETGLYTTDTLPGAEVDTLHTLALTVHYPSATDTFATACEAFFWYGETYSTSGEYNHTLLNGAGCDSVVTLHLTIHHPVSLTLPDTTVCETDFGYEYIWGDTIIRDAGTYTRYLKTKVGCDSIVTQTVHFSEMTYGERTVTAYDSYTTNMGITYRTSQHGPIEYYTNAAGCDSVVTLDLYIRHLQVVDTFPISVCSSELPFVWYGKSLTEAGIYTTDTIEGEAVNAIYMDTVHTVNLIVLPTSEGDTTATACESFVWYGENYSASGDYNHTLVNRVGCDSVVTLHLTIYHATTGDTTAIACDAFDWYGQTYTQSGEYNHTFVGGNSHGCDSTVTLHLTIRTSTTGEETREACVSYEWNNETYTASGDYTYHTTNVAGCDSTATLHLTIHQPTTGEETQEACMSYVWKNQTYTESGDYTFTTVNAAGCDSVVTLHLTILEGCATFDTVYYCLGLNTEHDEKIAEDRIRRYRAYVFESPAEWDYMEGVIVRGESHRTLVDLHRAEANLYAHYVNGLEPVSAITWSYRPDGASAYQTIEAGTQAQWIENGVIAVQVQFLCGHIYRSDMTTDMEAIGDEQSQMEGKKILKDGQIVIIRNGKIYTIFGLEIRD